jgi:lipase
MIASLVLVENNFTLKDTAWPATTAAISPAEADAVLGGFLSRREIWPTRFDVQPTTAYLTKANDWLLRQTGGIVQLMAQALVDTTGRSSYFCMAAKVFDKGPVHLVAGERSLAN